MKFVLYAVLALSVLVIVYFVILSVMSQSASVAKGLDNMGDVHPCADKPNCVTTSSAESRDKFKFSAWSLAAGKSFEDFSRFFATNYPEAEKVSEKDGYLHLVFRTKIFRFPDDVEFNVKDNLVHMRSQSRAGYSDLGKNRERLDQFAEELRNSGIIQ